MAPPRGPRYIAAMPNLLYVLAGGAAGAGLRYEAGRLALRQLGAGFPWGTLAVNLAGGLAMGLLAGAMVAQGWAERPLWLLLGVGLLGMLALASIRKGTPPVPQQAIQEAKLTTEAIRG